MKKNRIDSASEQGEMMRTKAPDPPAHITLRPGDLPFWKSVVRARDYASWTDIDLAHAANLSRCLADIEQLQREITTEGDTLTNAKGTQVVNPKHALLETLSRRSVALSRMLHVHAEATVGESRHQKKRSQKQMEIEGDRRDVGGDDDGLIPGLIQ